MSRLEAAVGELAGRGALGVAPYVTAGDGGLARTKLVLHALERAGATCVELGIPFSDPIADGPALQEAAQRSLAAGTTLEGVLDTVRAYRGGGGELPILAFTYANPLMRRGPEAAARMLAEAGVDGILVPDLPVEEADVLFEPARRAGLSTVAFVTPTTSEARTRAAAAASRGFLYVIGRLGITGARTELGGETLEYLERVRACADVPLGVGFGLAAPDQVAALKGHATLAIVGTALVRHVHAAGADDAVAAAAAETFVRGLVEAAG